jgi:hypothetical protein
MIVGLALFGEFGSTYAGGTISTIVCCLSVCRTVSAM